MEKHAVPCSGPGPKHIIKVGVSLTTSRVVPLYPRGINSKTPLQIPKSIDTKFPFIVSWGMQLSSRVLALPV
jgi:hypothetical protein